jgi:uncharacterized protein (TIGR02421 family)
MHTEHRDALLALASRVFEEVANKTRLLDSIQWPRSTDQAFFEKNAEALPQPSYTIDLASAHANLDALRSLDEKLVGDDALLEYLRKISSSYAAANLMLLAVGTRRFYELSIDQYGGARSTPLDADTTNIDLAIHLGRRMGRGTKSSGEQESQISAEEFCRSLEQKLATFQPDLDVKVVLDNDLSAKVIAGAKRVRVRAGATFSRRESESLFVHEIETHALTAQNGMAQPRLPFLRAGGPRTTRTQEGLAVLAELFDHSLSIERLRRLVERVAMVAMAEEGASFLDVYRHLLGLGVEPREAYLDTTRIFRGGKVEGGAPFTKDAAYLSGLAEVYNFLRASLADGAGLLAEVLVSGRLALEDLDLLLDLRHEGTLEPPRFMPRWLAEWDALLPYFAFTSFLNEIDLPPASRHFDAVAPLSRGLPGGPGEPPAPRNPATPPEHVRHRTGPRGEVSPRDATSEGSHDGTEQSPSPGK